MKLYKLTDQHGYTPRGKTDETLWKTGETHSLEPRDSPKLCSKDVLHAYETIELALLLNPIHANILDPVLWLVNGDIAVKDWGKVGSFQLTVTRRLHLPPWYKDIESRKRVQIWFAILCAEAVLHFYESRQPQDARPRKAIEAAKEYLKNQAYVDAADAADAARAADAAACAADAADAAYAAANAADAAVYAAYAAYAARADAAVYAAYAARAAAYDAYAARAAAYDADVGAKQLDFARLAKLAVKKGRKARK